MANQSWYPPLPPGWEARWDPNQRAFFFIDHRNKVTSWEDPRWANKQTLATPASAGHSSGHGETIPMHNMSHASPRHSPSAQRSRSPRHSPARQREETAFRQEREADGEMIARLSARFPEARPVIKDILRTCHHDEDEAAKQLMELGFESKDAPPPGRTSSSHASPARPGKKHSASSSSTSASPHRSSSATPKRAAASPARHQSPAKPQLSEAEKKRCEKRMCEEFSGLEPEVVKMALEACHYDDGKARITLDRVTKQWQSDSSTERGTASASSSSSQQQRPASSAGSQRPASSAGSQRPTSPAALGSPASLEPVALSQDRPSVSGTTVSSAVGRTSATSRSKTSAATKKTPTTTTTTPKPKQQQQQQRRAAKHVTIVTHGGQSPQHVTQQVVTSQPRRQSPAAAPEPVPVHHGGSGLARGPDRTLRVGPDPGLRVGPEQGLGFGPNPELCDGPDPDLLLGACMGADGPNPDYHHGIVADLVAGSAGSTGPNPSLRCAAEHPSPMAVEQRFLQTSI